MPSAVHATDQHAHNRAEVAHHPAPFLANRSGGLRSSYPCRAPAPGPESSETGDRDWRGAKGRGVPVGVAKTLPITGILASIRAPSREQRRASTACAAENGSVV